MDTLAEMRTAVQSDLTVGDESTLFTPTAIDLAINRAYRKAGALFPWPELQDARKTTTQTNQEYYDYPETWRSNSIWKLDIDGVRYGEDPDGSPTSFDDYLSWKEDNSTSTTKKWANQWRRFFIRPVPTVATGVISVWGIEMTATLSNGSDYTIFSYHATECNEAIVLEAVAILKAKGEQEKAGEFRSLEAKQILATAWGKIRMEQGKYEKIEPFFNVPDYYSGSGSSEKIGDFD